MEHEQIKSFAKQMRRKILDVSYACNSSTHLGGGLSIVDLTAVLYGKIMNFDRLNPAWKDRDRFILSKGHGVLGYYSALLTAGIISEETFYTFQTNWSDLIAHPVMNISLGIESSNGSLGQGLSMGVGLAIAAKKRKQNHHIYVLLGDGECNEGSVWEAMMASSHFKLDNLTAIVDYNRFQSDGAGEDIIDYIDLDAKWKSFGWNVRNIDGHNIEQILDAFTKCHIKDKPTVLIANTVKGKGVDFMENNNDWHHNRLSKEKYELALVALEQY